jgi:DNA ligase 1
VQFAELADAYGRLEATSKRLEMRTILADLIRPLRGEELAEVLYLSQGQLLPEYEGVELGVAGSLALRAVAQSTDSPETEVARRTKVAGDLGTTVFDLFSARGPTRPAGTLTVREVYRDLRAIADAKGESSQSEKVRILTELLRRAGPQEAKFLVRFVLGTLRVGVREMTILDALTAAFADGKKEARSRIEAAFNVSSDLGLVARTLVEHGIEGLARITIEVGRPVRAMLAEREPTLAAVLERMGGTAALEFKYDGLRVQAHIPAHGPVRLFSRRLEEMSVQFPELVADLPRAIRHAPAIVEGECVPIDPDTDEIQPFQEVSRRRGRKHDLDRVQTEIPVALFLFDVLLDGHEVVTEEDFPRRRGRLEQLVRPDERIRIAEQRVVTSVDEATTFLEEAVSGGAEGVMAKSLGPGSSYRAGARGYWWIKYKRDYTTGLTDSIDGVIVGGFAGRGRRAGHFGAFLLAVYDAKRDRFESFCKVGSGFDDEQLKEMPRRLRPFQVAERPPSVDTALTPDQWFRPGVVIEVRGAELTLSPIHRAAAGAVREGAGFALRFPRFTGRVRDDKGPTDATTARELLEMYRGQVRREAPEEAAER